MSIKIEIELEDDNLSYLTKEAENTLWEQTTSYAKELLREAIRIEEGERQEGANCEITSNIIIQASHVKKNKGQTEKRATKNLKIPQIVSSLSSLLTGFLYDASGFKDNMFGLYIFLIVFAIACSSMIFVIIKE